MIIAFSSFVIGYNYTQNLTLDYDMHTLNNSNMSDLANIDGSNDGLISGATVYNFGLIDGYSYEFDSSGNDYIETLALNNWGSITTVEIWFNSTPRGVDIGLFERDTNKEAIIQPESTIAPNELYIDTGNGASWDGANNKGTDVNDGNFHQLIVIFNNVSNILNVSLDGEWKSGSSSVMRIPDLTSKINIGNRFNHIGGFRGQIDNFRMWNNWIPTNTDIAELYNSGNGLTHAQLEQTILLQSVEIISPENNTRTNQQEQIYYRVNTSTDNVDVNCSLYVNSVFNNSDYFEVNTTINKTFNMTWQNGITNYLIDCVDIPDYISYVNSSIYYFDYDDIQPYINSKSPLSSNDTIFTDFNMDIIGNVTDDNLFRVNFTLFYPNGVILYNNYSGNLSTSVYAWNLNFNTTTYNNGNYSMFIDSADSHTNKDFKEAKKVTINKQDKKINFELDYDTIEIKLNNDIFGFNDISTEKLKDRYTFDLDFKNDLPQNTLLDFNIKSKYPIIYLKDSKYNAHFILNNKYWLDFENVKGNYFVRNIDNYNYNIKIYTKDIQKNFKFKSLGGLNEHNLSIDFKINNTINISEINILEGVVYYDCINNICNTTDNTSQFQTITDYQTLCYYSLDSGNFTIFDSTNSTTSIFITPEISTGLHNLNINCSYFLNSGVWQNKSIVFKILSTTATITPSTTIDTTGISKALLLFLEFGMYVFLLYLAHKSYDSGVEITLYNFAFIYGIMLAIFSFKDYITPIINSIFGLVNGYLFIVVNLTYRKK